MDDRTEQLREGATAHGDRMTLPLVAVAAVARNGVIGAGNDLPWRISSDLKHFKAVTLGHPVIMGRRTFESIGRPLPGRLNIVVTRDAGWRAEGVTVAASPDGAEALAARLTPESEAFVIGGAALYAAMLPRVGRVHLTRIHRDYEGDAHFPALDPAEWRETAREDHDGDPAFSFLVLERV